MSMGPKLPPATTPAAAPAPRRQGPLVPQIATRKSTSGGSGRSTGSSNLRIKREGSSGAPKVGINIPRI